MVKISHVVAGINAAGLEATNKGTVKSVTFESIENGFCWAHPNPTANCISSSGEISYQFVSLSYYSRQILFFIRWFAFAM